MSKLLTEISRIRELMGIKSEVLKESLSSSGRQRLQELLISLLKLSDNEATTFFKNLTEEDQNLLRALINSSDGKIVGNLSDAVTIASLKNFLKNGGTDAIKSVLAKAEILLAKELSEKSAKIGFNLINTSADVQKFLKTRKQSTGGNSTILDTLSNIEKNGGVEKSTIYDRNPEMWGVFFSDLENLKLTYPNKTDGVYDYLEKITNDILKMKDQQKYLVKINDVELKIANTIDNNVVDEIKIIVNQQQDISDKLKVLANSDQSIRQGEYLDIPTDIANQTELKNLMGVDKENFIKDLKTFEDLENLWVIVQHSDNDIEFQKEVLKILQNNQQTLETKFSTNSQDIKMGIAMLEDRVLINTKTSSSNFGDLTQGLQKYGSQGGLTDDGYWIPRPIDIDGNPIYFKTPNEWYNLNKETLDKINSKRSSMGLPNIEDYIKNMNDKFGNSSGSVKTTEDLSPRLKNKYKKVLNKIDEDLPLDKSEQQLKDDVEKFLNGENINLKDYEFTKTYIENVNKIIKNFTRNKKEYTSILKELIASIDNTTKITSNIENTFPKGLDKNIRNAINSDPNLTNFFKKLEEGKYEWVIDNETKEWIPTNMLDTNTNDGTTLFRDVLDIVMENDGKKLVEFTTLPVEEQKKLMNDVLTYIKTNKDSLKYKLLDSDRYIKNSQVSLVRGDAGEKLAKQTFEDNGFKVVWEGGRGNALDKTGVDMIVEKDGVYSLVSVKTIGHEFYPIAKGNKTGKPLIGFRQPTKIVTDTGYVAVIDTENKLIIFPPQPKFNEETGEIVGKGFNKKSGWTNVDLSSILIKNF